MIIPDQALINEANALAAEAREDMAQVMGTIMANRLVGLYTNIRDGDDIIAIVTPEGEWIRLE
jgi:hypothetical protein